MKILAIGIGTCLAVNATLSSISAQTNQDYRVLLVCNEPPEVEPRRENLDIIETDIRIEGPFDSTKGRINKQRKILHGLLAARAHNPRRVMVVDADDLLHRDLVQFAADTHDVDGLIINRGYRFNLGNPELRRCLNYHLVSGSSLIFPFKLSDFSTISSDEEIFAHHISREDHPRPGEAIMKSLGLTYRYVPFYAGIYVRGHEDSLRDRIGIERSRAGTDRADRFKRGRIIRRSKDLAWKAVGRLRGVKRIDQAMIQEFSGLGAWQ